MFKEKTTIKLHIDDTYNRIGFKIIPNTKICMTAPKNTILEYGMAVGKDTMEQELRKINRGYGILVKSSKLGNSRKYKFTNITVIEHVVTAIFKITFQGEIVGSILEKGIIQQIINNNGGSKVFYR